MTSSPIAFDANYASLVVRGIAADVLGEGMPYQDLTDAGILGGLPISYHQGGDQVAHVTSQNLRLAGCARRFEQRTGRPVHGILVRIPDPTPEDRSPFETTVHTSRRAIRRYKPGSPACWRTTAATGRNCPQPTGPKPPPAMPARQPLPVSSGKRCSVIG